MRTARENEIIIIINDIYRAQTSPRSKCASQPLHN